MILPGSCGIVADPSFSLIVPQNKPLQSEFQSNMDRLLGAQDRKRAPESEPSVQSTDKSVRGTQHEEFSEAAHWMLHLSSHQHWLRRASSDQV